MPRAAASLRLFVAIYPPAELAESWLRTAAGIDLPPHRPVPAEQVHLTLQFIGDTAVRELEAVSESVRRAGAGLPGFELEVLDLLCFPKRGPKRLIAAETTAPPTLLELKRRLVSRLARNPRKDSADRFVPHLTLARFRQPTRQVSLEAELDGRPFPVDRIDLMRSVLRPQGAQHDVVESVPLAGA